MDTRQPFKMNNACQATFSNCKLQIMQKASGKERGMKFLSSFKKCPNMICQRIAIFSIENGMAIAPICYFIRDEYFMCLLHISCPSPGIPSDRLIINPRVPLFSQLTLLIQNHMK